MGCITKKLILTLSIALMAVTAVHAQQAVVIERPGVLSDLVSAAGAIVALPLAAVEGIVVGTAEAAGTLVHGSTTVVVVPSAKPVPVPIAVTLASVMVTPSATVKTAPAVAPSTTIITMHGDGTVTTVTRHASAYELGPVIVAPVDPNHRVGTSPYANPYVYRHR